MNANKIYEKIKPLRIHKGWSQETMAEKLKLSVSSYAQIERGETNVDLARLMQIAEVLEVDLANLLDLSSGSFIQLLNSANQNCIRNNNIYLTETQCVHELEKSNLLLQERDKEIENMKKQIAQLEKLVAMLEKQVCKSVV